VARYEGDACNSGANRTLGVQALRWRLQIQSLSGPDAPPVVSSGELGQELLGATRHSSAFEGEEIAADSVPNTGANSKVPIC